MTNLIANLVPKSHSFVSLSSPNMMLAQHPLMRALVPQYHHNNCAKLPMASLWPLNEGKHFERNESTLWVLRSTHTSNHTQHRIVAIAGSQDPYGRFMPFKVLTFVQLLRGSHRELCTIVVVVLMQQHSHQGVLSEPHVWRAQLHERVAFWDQINN